MDKKRALVEIPRGFPKKPRAFETNSLLVSTAIGFLFHAAQALEYSEEKKKALRSVTAIHSKMPRRQNQVGKLILACVHRLWRDTDVTLRGLHD